MSSRPTEVRSKPEIEEPDVEGTARRARASIEREASGGSRRGWTIGFGYLCLVLTPLSVASWTKPQTVHSFSFELGRSAALLGIVLLSLQFVVAARIRSIERPYGLDVLFRFHRSMGLTAFGLLLSHPILLAAAGRGPSLLFGLDQPWFVWLGRITLTLLCLHIATSLFRRALRIRFEQWRKAHDLLAGSTLVLAFVHSWHAGGDLENPAMQTLWVALPAAALGSFGWHRLVKPRNLPRYRVDEVRREAGRVYTLQLTPPEDRRRFKFLPGQFHFLTLQRDGDVSAEEHHFTISSSPSQERLLTSTIKESGDFTATISRTRPGDTAIVEGPFGRFSYALHPEEQDLVFLAAGIGITPLMSMLRHMRDTRADRDVLLLYGNRKEEDILFRDELVAMEERQHPRLQVVHVLSGPREDWRGERGHVDRGKIERFCAGTESKAFYLCGPRAMTEQLAPALRAMGVPAGRIHAEAFSFVEGGAPAGSRDWKRRVATAGIVLTLLVSAFAAAAYRSVGF